MSDQAGERDRDSAPGQPEDVSKADDLGEPGVAGRLDDGDQPVDADRPDGAGEDEDSEAKGKKKRPFWREFAVILVAALVLTVLLKAFVVEVFSIPSGSMENTLQPGDRVLVNKIVYHFRGIARGDVVVFSGNGSWGPVATAQQNPVLGFFHDVLDIVGLQSDGTDYIKRVIGLPGDHVACCDPQGRLTVNGTALSERGYVHPGDPPSELRFDITVPPGRLWVMGDNRSDSADSRYHLSDPGHGTIPVGAVVGRASWIIWPLSRLGDLPIPGTFALVATKTGAMVISDLPVAIAGIVFITRRRRRSSSGIASGGACGGASGGAKDC